MNQEQRTESLNEKIKTEQSLKIVPSLFLFFVVLSLITEVAYLLTLEGIINSVIPAAVVLLLSGFLGQHQKESLPNRALIEDKE